MDKLPEAAAAYDAAVAEQPIPALGIYAAAVVLGLNVVDTINLLMREGLLAWEFFPRPEDHKNGLGVRVVRCG